jgi:hypothetical protein
MDARNFEVILVRYIGDITDGKSMFIAICMSELVDGNGRFLGCEYTEKWDKLGALFPEADIEALQQWCAGVREEFCSPETNHMAQEALKNCSNNIEVSVSRLTLKAADDPSTEMKKLRQIHSR